MKLVYIFLAALLMLNLTNLSAQPTLDKLFSSGIYNGNQVDILVHGPSGTSAIYFVGDEGFSSQLSPAWDSDSWQKGNIGIPTNGYLGFWYPYPEYTVNPLFYPGQQQPELSYYTGYGSDAIGDNLYTSAPWLDIAAVKGSFSADKLYFAIVNTQSSYPVSSGLTYFAYMPVLVDPDSVPEDNPIVFGLMYTVSVPGVINPGLYKITGSGFSGLTRIGEIETSVQDGYLLLSCSMADLLADPDFSSWFDPSDPRVASVATTSRITLVNGIQQADVTLGLDIMLRPQVIPLENLSAPQLSDAALLENQQGLLIPQIFYFDADQNFPRIASFNVDGGEEFPLSPISLGSEAFAAQVLFSTPGIPEPASWNELRFRFSDGDGFVYHTIVNSSAINDDNQIPVPGVILFPNPVRSFLTLKTSGISNAKYAVFNLRGQKIAEISLDGKNEIQLNLKGYKPGVYFLKASDGRGQITRFVKF